MEPAPPPRVETHSRLAARARGGARRPRATVHPLLEVRGVVTSFGGVVAVNEVDLVIPRGAIIGLIGPNGAGKTTFFNVVTGLEPAGQRRDRLRGPEPGRAAAQRDRGRAASRAPSSRSGSSRT